MKRNNWYLCPVYFRTLATLVLLNFAGVASAQDAQKVGFVDFERIVLQTPAGQRASQEFEKQLKAKQSQLDQQRTALAGMQKQFESEKASLTTEQIEQREQDFRQQVGKLQSDYRRLESELSESRAELIQQLVKQAHPVVRQVAKINGVTLVVDRKAVVWGEAFHDLTEQVKAQLQ